MSKFVAQTKETFGYWRC